MAKQYKPYKIPEKAIDLIPPEAMLYFGVIPISQKKGVIRVRAADPRSKANQKEFEYLKQLLGQEIRVVSKANHVRLCEAIAAYYGPVEELKKGELRKLVELKEEVSIKNIGQADYRGNQEISLLRFVRDNKQEAQGSLTEIVDD